MMSHEAADEGIGTERVDGLQTGDPTSARIEESSFILNRLILIGGPPRSGTTLLATILNQHPQCVTTIDNTVYESWALYYYRTRIGLVQELRERRVPFEEVQKQLLLHLVRSGGVTGVASSEKVAHYPSVEPAIPPASLPSGGALPGSSMQPPRKRKTLWKQAWRRMRGKRSPQPLLRHLVPLTLFEKDFYLCLKSPEISFVLPRLAEALPAAKFVLVYRPLIEIAESMYRKGIEWSVPSYHKRWASELDRQGKPMPPPGVPEEWHSLWAAATDVQRCVLYGASYLRAMALHIPKIAAGRVFLYDHDFLCKDPATVLSSIATFLGIDQMGFDDSMIRRQHTRISPGILEDYNALQSKVELQPWIDALSKLNSLTQSVSSA